MIRNKGGRWYVLSEDGKNLGDPDGYETRAEAVQRLRQIEYFKKRKGGTTKKK